jgi:hypothetical protein
MYKKNHKALKNSFEGKCTWHYIYKAEVDLKHTSTSNAVWIVANSFQKK